MIHIAFEHLYFKSRREEWAVRVWRDVKYKPPPKRIHPAPYKVEPEKVMIEIEKLEEMLKQEET